MSEKTQGLSGHVVFYQEDYILTLENLSDMKGILRPIQLYIMVFRYNSTYCRKICLFPLTKTESYIWCVNI